MRDKNSDGNDGMAKVWRKKGSAHDAKCMSSLFKHGGGIARNSVTFLLLEQTQ